MRKIAITLTILGAAARIGAAQNPPFAVYRDTAPPASAHPDSIGDVAELPELRKCGRPRELVGRLSGHGVVTYAVTRRGRVDMSSFQVAETEGISPAGLLSAARRLLADCQYRPARQAGEAVAVSVRHRVEFTTGTVPNGIVEALDEGRPVEEMPAVGRCEGLSAVSANGQVRLAFVIGLDGRPELETIKILSASNPTLRDAASRIARGCRYAPARSYGEPIRVLVTQNITFK